VLKKFGGNCKIAYLKPNLGKTALKFKEILRYRQVVCAKEWKQSKRKKGSRISYAPIF
jgi:hypothetical protein